MELFFDRYLDGDDEPRDMKINATAFTGKYHSQFCIVGS